jgi:hypothetical protein
MIRNFMELKEEQQQFRGNQVQLMKSARKCMSFGNTK